MLCSEKLRDAFLGDRLLHILHAPTDKYLDNVVAEDSESLAAVGTRFVTQQDDDLDQQRNPEPQYNHIHQNFRLDPECGGPNRWMLDMDSMLASS